MMQQIYNISTAQQITERLLLYNVFYRLNKTNFRQILLQCCQLLINNYTDYQAFIHNQHEILLAEYLLFLFGFTNILKKKYDSNEFQSFQDVTKHIIQHINYIMTYFSTCNLQIYCDLNPLIEFSQLLQQFTTQSITKEQITQYNQYVEQINQMADKFVSYYNILIQTTAFVLKKIKNKINEDQLIKIQSHLNHYKTCHTYFLRKRPPTIQYQNNHF